MLGFGAARPQLSLLANPALSDPEEYQRQYLVMYVAPDLTGPDYGLLSQMSAPGGFIDRFVSLGGVAVINVAGDATVANMAPRGVDYIRTGFTPNVETIITPAHPYFTGEGYAGRTLAANSFVGWGPTDRGYLSEVPDDATILLHQPDGEPTWIEYNHGAGRVIVTTLTYCSAGTPSMGAALDNLLEYSRFFYGLAQTPGLTVTPTHTPTPTATGPTRTPTNTRTPTFTRAPSLTPTLTELRGDFDGDDDLDQQDLDALIAMLFVDDPPSQFDLSTPADGRVNAADVAAWLELFDGS